jgi:hypothetical protein
MPALIETPQLFPKNGLLAENLNLSYGQLGNRLLDAEGVAYSYVVNSVRMNDSGQHFEQHGSAPNFQGGRLTLCTCKHQMRTSLGYSEWPGTWVAGFTSRRIHENRNWLFYLTKVQKAYESHADLWESLPAGVRQKKSTKGNFLGDVFVPRGKVAGTGRFDPHRYYTPSRHSHRRNSCDNGWHNDIDYWCSDRYGRPPLLVGDPHLTFLWDQPLIAFDKKHCRNFKTWDNLAQLLRHLRGVAP